MNGSGKFGLFEFCFLGNKNFFQPWLRNQHRVWWWTRDLPNSDASATCRYRRGRGTKIFELCSKMGKPYGKL